MSRVWRPPIPALPGQPLVTMEMVRGKAGEKRLKISIQSAMPTDGTALDQLVVAISMTLRGKFYPVFEKRAQELDGDDDE